MCFGFMYVYIVYNTLQYFTLNYTIYAFANKVFDP